MCQVARRHSRSHVSLWMRSSMFDDCGAIIDGCYRYRLWRQWDARKRRQGWIMLNPSTADATTDDATIRVCVGRARRLGYGSIEVLNIFALRAANPSKLRQHADPIGPENNEHLLAAFWGVASIVVAWGNGGRYLDRGQAVLDLLFDAGLSGRFATLGLTAAGQPRHPLRIAYAVPLQRFPVPPATVGTAAPTSRCE